MRFWLLKSEPHEYSIYQLEAQIRGRWDGIRNYQARNFIREMQINDIAYFYHSNCPAPGIYGKMKITSASYADPTAFDKSSPYFDTKGDKSKPRWLSVDVEYLCKFKVPLLLPEIKAISEFGPSPLTAKGNRLSIIPITNTQSELLQRLLEEKKEELDKN
jgi:predicted RNA-binding protein with PUA-like domain